MSIMQIMVGIGGIVQTGPDPLFDNANSLVSSQSTFEVNTDTGITFNSDGTITYWGNDNTPTGPTKFVATTSAGVIQYFDFRIVSVTFSGSTSGYFGISPSFTTFYPGTGQSSGWVSPTSGQAVSISSSAAYGSNADLTGTLEIRNRSNPTNVITRSFGTYAYY